MGCWLFTLSMRHPPRPDPAARHRVPVHWGLLALVAGAHAAGIGLLAGAGDPAPRETLRRSAETMITARLIAPPAAGAERTTRPAPQAAHPPLAPDLPAHPAPELPPPPATKDELPPAPLASAAPLARSAPSSRPAPKSAAARKPGEPPATASPSALTRMAPPAADAVDDTPGRQAVATEPAPSPPPAVASSTPATVAAVATAPPAPHPSAAGASTVVGGGTAADHAAEATTPARYDADYLDNPAPAYPAASRRLGEEGTVLLRVRVMHDGRAQEIEVLTSSGSPRLDRAATEALRRWRFVPASEHGRPVVSWLRVPIVFRLED